jgi:hypothetical protein
MRRHVRSRFVNSVLLYLSFERDKQHYFLWLICAVRKYFRKSFSFSKNHTLPFSFKPMLDMSNDVETTETRDREESQSSGVAADSDAPSGFILKLYQMVNGAPDEVISVSRLKPFISIRTV